MQRRTDLTVNELIETLNERTRFCNKYGCFSRRTGKPGGTRQRVGKAKKAKPVKGIVNPAHAKYSATHQKIADEELQRSGGRTARQRRFIEYHKKASAAYAASAAGKPSAVKLHAEAYAMHKKVYSASERPDWHAQRQDHAVLGGLKKKPQPF